MTLGRFDNATASDISAGLAPPTQVRKSDVDAVRKNYGIDAGFKPKGLSDTSLYSHSVKFVLDWWKKNNPAVAAPATPAPAAPPSGSGGSAATVAPAPIATPGTVVKPPTVSSPATTPSAAQLAATGTPASSYMAPTASSNPALSSAGRVTLAVAKPLTTTQAATIMTQMGLKGATPPKTALASTAALRAWVTAQLKARATAPAARQQAASLARTAY